MNIMLTSVVERTHEIGIRRTVGATRHDVFSQFLIESLLMTLTGGLLGIVIGAAISVGITPTPAGARTSPLLRSCWLCWCRSWWALFSGLYPAVKAARLQPVDAVRYE